jgi:hypothetical protein
MKIILYIVSILAIGGAAYFSYEHSAKFKKQQQIRLETIERNNNVCRENEKKDGELKAEQKLLAAEKTKRDELNASIESLASTKGQLKRELAQLQETLEAQKAEIGQVEEAIALAVKAFQEAGLPGDINLDNVGEKVAELKERRKQMEREQERLAELVAAADKRLVANKAEANRQTNRRVTFENNIRQNTMEFPITAVDHEWGYVVIGAGQKHGFTPQGALLVKRGGRLIGKLKPSSVEQFQTVADFESISPGVRFQRGDMVMLAEPRTN